MILKQQTSSLQSSPAVTDFSGTLSRLLELRLRMFVRKHKLCHSSTMKPICFIRPLALKHQQPDHKLLQLALCWPADI